jgi:tRNA (guanine-N7-)-methyltransferase
MTTAGPLRPIRSYVLRAGRMTAAQDRVLSSLLPRYALTLDQLTAPAHAFARRAPLHLEIGIGNGENLAAMAGRLAYADFIGCEVHRPGLGHVLNLIEARSLSNVRLAPIDVHDTLGALAPQCLDAAYMFFPDPWPKKRHHKRRLLSVELLTALAAKLKPNGCFYFATDHAEYGDFARAVLNLAPGWLNLAGPDARAPRPHQRIATLFNSRARAAGRPICELVAAYSTPS